MGTLTSHATTYIAGRVARGEIGTDRAAGTTWILSTLDASFGNRPMRDLTAKAIDRWREVVGHYAPATRRTMLGAVRQFCRWLVKAGEIDTDPTEHVEPIPQPRRSPVVLHRDDVETILNAAPDLRARAVLSLMVGCGCRCVDVARLRVEDYDPRSATLRVTGKGMHERVLPVPAVTVAAINAYLDASGRVAGPLIRSTLNPAQPLNHRTLSKYVAAWMAAAGVKVARRDGRSAHGLRRTAAADVMAHSGKIRAVQAMLGHASVETTARHYLPDVPLEDLRDAMEGRDYGQQAAA